MKKPSQGERQGIIGRQIVAMGVFAMSLFGMLGYLLMSDWEGLAWYLIAGLIYLFSQVAALHVLKSKHLQNQRVIVEVPLVMAVICFVISVVLNSLV